MEKVAVTLIRGLVQGDEYIAELRLRRDTAKVLYLNVLQIIGYYSNQSSDWLLFFMPHLLKLLCLVYIMKVSIIHYILSEVRL